MDQEVEQLLKLLLTELVEKLQDEPQADTKQLVAYLNASLKQNSQMDHAVSRMIQINKDNAKSYQTLVEGGIANIGEHYHVDKDTLKAVLNTLISEQKPNFPQNLPNSGIAQFVGREQVLTEIADQLKQSKAISISTLTGMGGVGKTEVALQYAWQEEKKKTYPGGICWLNVVDSDPGTQILSYAGVYLKLKLPEEGTLEERVRYCWQTWVEGDTLIIFDDVRSYEQIGSYLPPTEETRFKVIITTRLNHLSAKIKNIEIKVLLEADALDLLRSYVTDGRIDTELDQAKAICRNLGYLPLALELVARVLVRRKNWTLAEVQGKLKDNGLEDKSLIYASKFNKEMTAERGVKAAFELSWQELNSEPEAQQLAQFLSLFALTPIPKALINGLFPDEDTDNIDEWLTDSLVNFSLVQDIGNNKYELHTLIHQAIPNSKI